jgi:transposase
MEQLNYNLLYRWFVGLGVDEPVWVPTVFTKNRERLLEAEVAHKFLAELLNHRRCVAFYWTSTSRSMAHRLRRGAR